MLDVVSHFPSAKREGAGWSAKCPAHHDQRASLSIGTGDDGRVLLKCHAGCSIDAILAAAHLEARDLFPETSATTIPTIVATYPYHDEGGAHLYDVVRFDPKDFRQRRADGVWSMKGVRRVIYRLRELQGQTIAYVGEGEKDADRLWAIGLPGTTSPGGAAKWRPAYARQLLAASVEHVVVLPDNDEPGRKHAEMVAASCHAAGIKVKIVPLDGLPLKGDVSDWIEGGHTKADLIAAAKGTPLFVPPAVSTHQAEDRNPHNALALTSLRDLLAEPDDHVDYLVSGRIAFGSTNLFAGKPKSGKSTAARVLALEVARGGSWLGFACLARPVWYLVLEDKRSEVRRHFRDLGATGAEPVRFIFPQATRDVLAQVHALAEQEHPGLIIVDTLQRLIRAEDLNDYAEVTTKLTPILALARETGAAVLLVHHASKSERGGLDSVLGSTALTGSVDNVFLLARTDRYRVLSSIQRIGGDLSETVLTMDETGMVIAGPSRHDADLATIQAGFLAALGSGSLTRTELLEHAEARRQLKLEALRRLVDSGTIMRLGSGTKAEPYRYEMPGRGDSGSAGSAQRTEPEFSLSLLAGNANVSRADCGSQVPTVPEVPREPGSEGQDDGRERY